MDASDVFGRAGGFLWNGADGEKLRAVPFEMSL